MKETVSIDSIITQLMAVLGEAFEGPKERWSYFTDTGADAGMFATIGKLTAEEATRVLGETSIAAHVNHVLFGLEASAAWIQGNRTTRDWKGSWRVSSIEEADWKRLLERLRAGYQTLRRAIPMYAATTPEAMGGAVGALAHAAYHLGAIRQKVTFARKA